MRRACDRDLSLLHRLEKRGLDFGRGTVDLVRQDDVAEDWTWLIPELATAFGRVVDLRARDVRRQQIRRELNPREVRFKIRGERFHGARFREPRKTFNEQIAVGEQTHNQAIDESRLSDDRFADLVS